MKIKNKKLKVKRFKKKKKSKLVSSNKLKKDIQKTKN